MFESEGKTHYWMLFGTAIIAAALLIGLSFLKMSDFWAGVMRFFGGAFALGSVLLFANANSNLPIVLRGCISTTQKIEDDFLERFVKDVSSKLSKNKVATDQVVRLMKFCAILIAYGYNIDDLQLQLSKKLDKKVSLTYDANYPWSSMLAASRLGTEEWGGFLKMSIGDEKPLVIQIW